MRNSAQHAPCFSSDPTRLNWPHGPFSGAADSALRTLFAKPRPPRPCPIVPGDETQPRRQRAAAGGGADARQSRGRGLRPGPVHGPGPGHARPGLAPAFRAGGRARKPTTWPGPRTASTNWATGRRCSIRSGMRARSAWAWWRAGWATAVSLGFVVETERQVEAHLQSHLDRLPAGGPRVARHRRADEGRRGRARRAGAAAPAPWNCPLPAKALMRAAAKVMTTTAHYI